MSTLDLQTLNPYQSPQAASVRQIVVASTASHGVTGSLVRRGMLYRRIHLSGRLETFLDWNGRWPREVVRIDGRRAASRHAVWYVPRFDFQVQTTHGPSDVSVEVRVLVPVSWVKAFRVTVDGNVVYSEGRWPPR